MEHATFVVEARDERQSKPLTRYEDDAHAWAFEQAALLKAGRFVDLDLINLADEIEDVANHEYDKLESNLAIFIQHLLKWDYQENRRSRSWASSIKEHRRRVARHLELFKSLNGRKVEALAEGYNRGRGDAVIETDLPDGAFPGRESLLLGRGDDPSRRLAGTVTQPLRVIRRQLTTQAP